MGKDRRRIVETAELFAERLVRNHGEDARLEALVLCARSQGRGHPRERARFRRGSGRRRIGEAPAARRLEGNREPDGGAMVPGRARGGGGRGAVSASLTCTEPRTF
jgi:hypothetical protein